MSNARDKANIPSLNFSSTGIDDNATSTAITINSNGQVAILGSTTSFDTTASANGLQAYYETDSGLATLGSYSSGGTTSLSFHTNASGGASSEKMRLTSTGLGIGTSSPSQTLHVLNGTSSGGLIQYDGQSNAEFGLRIQSNISGGNFESDFASGTTALLDLFANSSTTTGGDLLVARTQSATPVLLVKGNGNIGIGETAPFANVHVKVSDSGVTSLNSAASGLFIESANSTGMTIGSGTTNVGRIVFTDNSNDLRGMVEYNHNNDAMRFYSGGGERLRIDSSGNVGIGTSSAGSELHVVADDVSQSWSPYDGTVLTIENNDTDGCILQTIGRNTATNEIWFGDDDSRNIGRIRYEHSDNGLEFWTNSSERMRINSSGVVTVGKTSTGYDVAGVTLSNGGYGAFTQAGNPALILNRLTSEGSIVEFRQANGLRGTISVGGSATAYNTSSDYRLKENVSYDFDATTRLKQLKPARFNFIADANTTVDGFLAHEVSSIVPEAITGTKDAVDEDGNIQPQQIDQAKLVPLLVKTIQELEARITTLEANNP